MDANSVNEGKPLAFSYRRFSSAQQKDGNSIKRQTDAAQAWCDANGYELSSSNFEDLGVSAFKGANAEVGALRGFLEAVEEGSVPQGSTLLVESLDRLSRQHWQRGLALLQDIVESGVNLVTLFDGKMFKANELIDFADGIMLLVGFQRANEESEVKSKRLTAAWGANTDETLAGNRVRSSQTPAWIKVIGDPKTSREFEVIDDKAALVRDVFERFANGERPVGIARDLVKCPELETSVENRTEACFLSWPKPFGSLKPPRKVEMAPISAQSFG